MSPYAALRESEFQYYLFARFFITMALSLPPVLLGWRLYELTENELVLGNVFLAELIPALALALYAGHIVDLYEKRKLLLVCYFGYVVFTIALLVITLDCTFAAYPLSVIIYGIYAIMFLGGIIRAFSDPVGFALLPRIVPRELLVNAGTWSSSAWQMGRIVGPAFAGLSYYWIGLTGTFYIMLVFVLIGAFSISRLSPKPPLQASKEKESIWNSLSIGLRFVFRTKEILAALSLDMFAVLFGGAVALLPVFAKSILLVGTKELGLLQSAPALGTFLTLLVLAYHPIVTNVGTKLLWAVFGFGVSIIVFGLSTNFYLSLFALFMSGLLDGVSVNVRRNILQTKTPEEMLGRVGAVNSMFIGSSNELGGYESGLTARIMGAVHAVVMGGCLTLLVVAITWVKVPSLRKMKLE